jgi:hypothetical protein
MQCGMSFTRYIFFVRCNSYGSHFVQLQMIESRFRELLDHSMLLLKKKWSYGILDDFVTKQLPNNVTWGLSLLYAVENNGDRAMSSTQGEISMILKLHLSHSLILVIFFR